MKIVKVIGGLGNQMFQYAFSEALKYRFPEDNVLVDISQFDSYSLHNGLELEQVFGIKINPASYAEVKKYSLNRKNYNLSRILRKLFPQKRSEFVEKIDYNFDENALLGNKVYYEGYWQSYRYFNLISDSLRSTFVFKQPLSKINADVLDIIKEINSVSIHVRRGDYLSNPMYSGICTLDYYQNAIKIISSKIDNPVFFFFSNDIGWCKENFQDEIGLNQQYFIDWNKGRDSYIDMYLMTQCKHNIIANSSFSWWGAWLNNNDRKLVVCPQRMINSKKITTFDQPSDWILI